MFDAIVNRIANEAGLIVLLLVIAVVFLWRELQKERINYVSLLRETVSERKEISDLLQQFQTVLKGNVDALDENTQEIATLKRDFQLRSPPDRPERPARAR